MPNDEMFTDRILNIPHALAIQFSRGNQERYEELKSEGNLALVKAARDFDPTRGAKWSSFAYGRVRFVMISDCTPDRHNKRYQWETRRRDIGEATSVQARPEGPIEDRELAFKLYDKIKSPISRAVYWMSVVEGFSLREIARRVKLPYHKTKKLYVAASRRLAECAKKLNRRHANNLPKTSPPRSDSQKQAASRYQLERFHARRMMGELPLTNYYIADDSNRVLIGSSQSQAVLMDWLGLPRINLRGVKHAAVANAVVEPFGLRFIHGPEARRLFQLGYTFEEKVIRHHRKQP